MTWLAAPTWHTTEWLNSSPLTLEQLRGRVVLLHAFQMRCPGCVTRGIPQAQRVAEIFAEAPLVVVGLHTVFEDHAAMSVDALRGFLREHHVRFPVGVDAPDPDGRAIPQTMRAYAMQGTPTTVLIDAQGRVRRHVFGVHDDLLLGAELQTLLLETVAPAGEAAGTAADGCERSERAADEHEREGDED